MCLTIIVTSLLMVAIKPSAAEAEFTPECIDIELNARETHLLAKCLKGQDGEGDWHDTKIDLTKLIDRDRNGRLEWRWKVMNYTKYCQVRLIEDENLDHTILRGRCDIPHTDRPVMSELDLDERIIVVKGALIYAAPGNGE